MTELDDYDVSLIVRTLPKEVVQALQAHPGTFLAGGFIRAVIAHEEIADIDLFAGSKQAARDLIVRVGGFDPTIETDNAYTCTGGRVPIQAIHRWTFDSPQACVESFDFTIARAAVWWDGKWKSCCDPRFYCDLAAKRLVYCAPDRDEEAGGSLLRLLKFCRRGYSAPLSTTGAVIARLVKGIDTESGMWQATEKEQAGVITGLLREVDPLTPEINLRSPFQAGN